MEFGVTVIDYITHTCLKIKMYMKNIGTGNLKQTWKFILVLLMKFNTKLNCQILLYFVQLLRVNCTCKLILNLLMHTRYNNVSCVWSCFIFVRRNK